MSAPTWNKDAIQALFELPFFELIYRARTVHKENFAQDEIELCKLFSLKTGKCPEDCSYCSQSAHYETGVDKTQQFDMDEVLEDARKAKQNGARRFCMSAAWRSPVKKDFPKVLELIKAVKAEGMETCVTLGMLDKEQTAALKEAGLDYYNHNLDTSREYYTKITTTRCYDDRLNTIKNVREAGISVCCGGILGLGESRDDRVGLLWELANFEKPPQSVPINQLMPMPGTPLENTAKIDSFEFIRTIAVARIVMPKTMLRLSAGRTNMSEELQAWCFFAGANSIFIGDKLLTAPNPEFAEDSVLLNKLNLTPCVENPLPAN